MVDQRSFHVRGRDFFFKKKGITELEHVPPRPRWPNPQPATQAATAPSPLVSAYRYYPTGTFVDPLSVCLFTIATGSSISDSDSGLFHYLLLLKYKWM